jgi:EmrB/QacA subfamily drug resistance transporter
MPDDVRNDTVEQKPGARTWLALGAIVLGVFLIANDFTALSVAIPSIEEQLHTTVGKAQWVINGYALVFGVLIVTGGRLADLFGRKRAFLAGAAVFGLFSLLSGLAPTLTLLIVSRALMGVGGALMWPAALGLGYAVLPPARKALAGGLILGVSGLGNAVGPLLGGWLTDAATWRLVFFINVPITVVAMLVVLRLVPESGGQAAERAIDYPGVALLSAGTVAVLMALDLGTDGGFGRPSIVLLLVAGLALLAMFFLVERGQGEAALLPRSVLRNRTFSVACLAVLFMAATFFSAVLFLPQLMQKQLGFSALLSGAGLLPLMGAFALTSFVAGPLYGRIGPRIAVSAGAALLVGGIVWLSGVSGGSTYASLVGGMLVLGAGVGLFFSSIITVAVTALDPSQSSLAGGILYMCEVAGGAVGLGLNTAIVLHGPTLAEGMRMSFRVDAVLALIGLGICIGFVHGPTRSAAHAAAPVHHHRVRV